MPRTNKQEKQDGHQSGRASKPRAKFMGYVNYSPSEGDKRELREFLQDGQRPSDDLADILLNGYRLNVSWDSYNSSFSASLYCTDVESPNAGWTLSQRAGNVDAALERVIFVHVHVLHGDWSVASRKTDEWDE